MKYFKNIKYISPLDNDGVGGYCSREAGVEKLKGV